jgi:hypothetical protein
MKTLLAAALLVSSFATPSVWAYEGGNKQHQRMAVCNTEAKGQKGDERKTFMKKCLKDKKNAQHEKMKVCNTDAEGKKGDERKVFMKECLSK